MLRQDLDSLPDAERRRLIVAHNAGLPQYVRIPGGRFIGVNVNGIRHLIVIERAGDWASGKVKTNSN